MTVELSAQQKEYLESMQPVKKEPELKFAKKFKDRCSRFFGNQRKSTKERPETVKSFFHHSYSLISDTTSFKLNRDSKIVESQALNMPDKLNTPLEHNTQRYSLIGVNKPENIYAHTVIGPPSFTLIDLPCNNSDIVKFDAIKKVKGSHKINNKRKAYL